MQVWRYLTCTTLVVLLGCSQSGTVSGTVSYEGKPVEEGFITFHPVNSQDATQGAPIRKGQYVMTDAVPGKKRVQVTTQPLSLGPDQKSLRVNPQALIPPNAKGNMQSVELTGGDQVVNIELRKP